MKKCINSKCKKIIDVNATECICGEKYIVNETIQPITESTWVPPDIIIDDKTEKKVIKFIITTIAQMSSLVIIFLFGKHLLYVSSNKIKIKRINEAIVSVEKGNYKINIDSRVHIRQDNIVYWDTYPVGGKKEIDEGTKKEIYVAFREYWEKFEKRDKWEPY